MDSSRQLLLGTGVFLGGGMLLFAMVKQMDTPSENVADNEPKIAEVSTQDSGPKTPMTADLATEERILEQKRIEREKKVAELDRRAREFLSEQEKAEILAMQKARDENQQYRDNAAEPIVDEAPEEVKIQQVPVTKPVVTARTVEVESPSNQSIQTTAKPAQTQSVPQAPVPKPATAIAKKPEPEPKPKIEASPQRAPSSPQDYTVQRGDGLIKLASRYNIPVEALSQANKLPTNAALRVGQHIVIPSHSQVDRLVRDYSAGNNNQTKAQTSSSTSTTAKPNPAPTSRAPSSQLDYKVQRGDGLIKLSRQYNVPVEALAQANNMSTGSSLRVGQSLTIPSRRQVERLQREAEQRKAAEANKRDAQKRLADARRAAANGEAKGTFGVQVALADNQQKADEVVKKLKAAGYSATTSKTSRGVRVIVGPEKGKDAALALKDKINADSRTGVNNAWVLYWR